MGGGGDAPEIEETAAERALAEVSAEKFRVYQEKFKPLEQQYMNIVDDKNGKAYQGLMMSQSANAATRDLRAAESQMYSGGLNPNIGASVGKSAVLSQAIERTKAAGMAQGMQSAQNAYLSGLANVNAIGSGQEAAATSSTRSLAQQSANQAKSDAQNAFISQQANQEMKGAVVGGLAAGATNYMGSNDFKVRSGSAYDTNFMSEQSNMLANQQRGL